jgi:hypothetical protein
VGQGGRVLQREAGLGQRFSATRHSRGTIGVLGSGSHPDGLDSLAA